MKTKAVDLKVGDVILDGIASRVKAHIHHADLGEVYMHAEDGNGYLNVIRVSEDAELTHFADWTDEDWTAYRAL